MKTIRAFLKMIVVVGAIAFGGNTFGQNTTIDHGNGEHTTVSSNKEGSTIERGGTKETTRESHKEAVDRVTKESKDKGEKATVQK